MKSKWKFAQFLISDCSGSTKKLHVNDSKPPKETAFFFFFLIWGEEKKKVFQPKLSKG